MQHQGARPVQDDRPSLLSPDEQAVSERQGILSSLDGMQGPAAVAPAKRSRPRALTWGGAAVGAVALGAAFVLAAGSDERQDSPAPVVAAAAVPSVADAPRPAPAAMPAPAAPAPVPAVPRDEPVPALANPLAEMAPPSARAAAVHDPATHASGQPEHHKAHAAQTAQHKRHEKTHEKAHDKTHEKAHDKAHDKAHEKAHDKTHEKAHEKTHDKSRDRTHVAAADERPKAHAAHEPDHDVLLLAALVSHIEPKKGKATTAQQLDACKRYNADGETQCRARVCEKAGSKEAACKGVRAAAAGT